MCVMSPKEYGGILISLPYAVVTTTIRRAFDCLLPARRSKRGTWYGNDAGWLDVTRRYCINTAKPILNVFRPSGSPIILISSDPCADTQFQA